MSHKKHHHPNQPVLKAIEHDEEAEIFLQLASLSVEDRQLAVQEHILRGLLRNNVLQRENLNASLASMGFLEEIYEEQFTRLTSFRITQEPTMAITGIIPGSTGTFTATPLNAAGQPLTVALPAAPVWTSSDPLAVVTAAADGLSASVAVDTTAPQSGSFVLTVASADGTVSTPVTVPYDAVPVDNTLASFGINQTS